MARFCCSLIVLLLLAAGPAQRTAIAQGTCTAKDFGTVIDAAGEALRDVNAANTPAFDAKLTALAKAKGWSETELPARARPLIQDAEILAADERVNELYGRINALGDEASGASPDCAKLKTLRTDAALLKQAIEKKWARMFANLDAAVAVPAAEPPKIVAKVPETTGSPKWQTETALDPAYGTLRVPKSTQTAAVGTPAVLQELETYTIGEIQGAGRGFFGSISTGLASVLAFAFEQAGRPTGYILGKEGGGAIFAGLRFGEGRLHTKSGGSQKLYWQGPSIGTDFGAEGGRTIILIYGLKRPEEIFQHFGGVDGSAYVVGGVGITFLGNGALKLAPIRSGLGLRLGANIGFLKFTREETINPF